MDIETYYRFSQIVYFFIHFAQDSIHYKIKYQLAGDFLNLLELEKQPAKAPLTVF
jgi:hypothetical protein